MGHYPVDRNGRPRDATAAPSVECRWCSSEITRVYHTGPCPHVRVIEYHPDGMVKRVEFGLQRS